MNRRVSVDCTECGQVQSIQVSQNRARGTRPYQCRSCMLRLRNQPVHGHRPAGRPPSPTYQSWKSMKDRCRREGCNGYARYGGRGISVCSRWDKFEHFLADMGVRPEGETLDRIDNDGNYGPDNCRWATASEQAYNRSAA